MWWKALHISEVVEMQMKQILGVALMLLTPCHYELATNAQPLSFPSNPDDVDQVTVAARAAAVVINSAVDSRRSQIRVNYDLVKSKLAQADLERARAIQQLKSTVDSLEDLIKQLEDQCEKNQDQIKQLKNQIEALLREIDDIAKGNKVFASIAQDRTRAAAFATLITSSNKAALLDLLKHEAAAQDVEVREAKAIGGINIVFRIGTITHCLSTNLQCSGKSYSLTR